MRSSPEYHNNQKELNQFSGNNRILVHPFQANQFLSELCVAEFHIDQVKSHPYNLRLVQ